MTSVNKTTAANPRENTVSASLRFVRAELARSNLFKDANLDMVEPLLKNCAVRLLAGGEVLVRAGSHCPALYLILSGSLRVQDPSGTLPDTLMKPGDSVGELFLFKEAVVPWTVSAVDPARVLVIDDQAAWALINGSHAVARNLLTLLSERSRVGSSTVTGELKTTYKRHATLDEITGLHNRVWLESILPRQMTRSQMSESPLALLLVEIDEYDDYIDQFGPAAGEHARYAAAQTLVGNVRPTDMVACYGTYRFAIVLPDATLSGACLAAERVRLAVNEAVVMMSDESILPSLTVSIGAAQYTREMNTAAFLVAAETALLSAKAVGGNRVGMLPAPAR